MINEKYSLVKVDKDTRNYSDLSIDQSDEDKEQGLFWIYVGNKFESIGIKISFEEFEKIKEVVEELKVNQ